MDTIRRTLGTQTDEQVADWMANISPGSNNEMTARAEFLRRQTALQREATQAAKDAATYTKENARYMLWSVIVLAVSAFISAVVAILQYFNHFSQPPPERARKHKTGGRHDQPLFRYRRRPRCPR